MKRQFVILVMLLSFAIPVFSQEATLEPGSGDPVVEVGNEIEVAPDAPPTDIGGEEPVPPNADEALDNLLRIFFASAIALFVDAPLTVIVVSLIKRFKQLDFLGSRTWAAIVAVVLWVLFTVAQTAGYEMQFTSLLKVMETALPPIASLFFALFGTGVVYQGAKRSDAPIVSYQKPESRKLK